jgi:hypothetical protein
LQEQASLQVELIPSAAHTLPVSFFHVQNIWMRKIYITCRKKIKTSKEIHIQLKKQQKSDQNQSR